AESAAPLRTIVPWAVKPPNWLAVSIVTALSEYGATRDRFAVCVTELQVAVMLTEEGPLTAAMDTWNFALDAPGGTVTVGTTGNASVGLLLERVTVRPVAGAGPPRVTVPSVIAPPITDAGLKPATARSGGLPCVFRSTVAVNGFR